MVIGLGMKIASVPLFVVSGLRTVQVPSNARCGGDTPNCMYGNDRLLEYVSWNVNSGK